MGNSAGFVGRNLEELMETFSRIPRSTWGFGVNLRNLRFFKEISPLEDLSRTTAAVP